MLVGVRAAGLVFVTDQDHTRNLFDLFESSVRWQNERSEFEQSDANETL